ncbi:MAG: ABC transporter substrate-binding protein [Arcobacter sp.]|uniref:ABC transporter substrate-binding protein n=1 Tax=Arcobacter sp. TaxID=1872629 RepID=UPI003B00F018
MQKQIKLLFILFLSLFSALYAKDLEKVSIQLNWKYQFEFAGFIAAYEKGYYKELGFDVEIREYESKINVINEVKNKKADFGVYDLSLLEYYDEKKPLMLLANYMKKSALVFVAKQDIITPYDFKNKIIMAEKSQLDKSILLELLKKFEIKKSDFKEIKNHDFSPESFISGNIDIMTAYLSNELYKIKKSKVPYTLIDPANYGLYNFSLNLFTLRDSALSNQDKMKKIIEATNRGWKYAFEHKKELVDIIYNKYSKLKSKDALLFEAVEIEKLMMPNLYELGSIRDELVKDILSKLEEFHASANVNINDIVFNTKDFKSNNILTNEDKRYLNSKRKINVCIDPNWLPFEKIENGRHIGISREYMDYFQSVLKRPINLIQTKTWSESLEKFKAKECDILSLAMETDNRKKYANFTKPYISSHFVVATKNEEIFIPDMESIIGKKKLAVVKGYAIIDLLKRRYKYENIIEVDSVKEGLEKVAKGEVYGFIDCLASIGYEIQKNFIGELKIAGKFDNSLDLSIAVQKDDLALLEIFNKVIKNISEDKKHEIYNKWVNVKFDSGIDYSIIWKIVLGFLIILLLIGYRQKELLSKNRKIEEQKNKLKESNNQFKRIQKELEKTLKSFETLLSSTMDSIYVVEKNICIDTNENGVSLLGFQNKRDLIGQNIFKFIENSGKKDILKNLYENHEPFEINIKDKDRKIIPSLVKVNTTNFEGKAVYIISVIDLREIKEKEMIFFRQSKMAAMGEMIGNIAHQWRQPLSVISAVSTGLKLRLSLGEYEIKSVLSSLDNMNESAQYLSQTIDDFRNFYKTDKEKTYVISNQIIDKNKNLIGSSLKDNGIEFIIKNSCEGLEVNTYLNELIQATVNIFNNAKDALLLNNKEGERFIFFELYQKDDYLVLSIKDNAGGISLDIKDKIFEPYFTTKHKSNGTGIGLYMTHQIIENHIDGKIEVLNEEYTWENKKLKGANFLIYIPTA